MNKELKNPQYKQEFQKSKPQVAETELDRIAERKAEMEQMKLDMPYMKMRKEYNDLQMALWEQDMQLGKSIVDQDGKVMIPGIFGFELYLRQQHILQEFHEYRSKLRQQIEEGERVQKLIERFKGITGSVQMTSRDMAQIDEFVTGTPSTVVLTEDSMTYRVPDGESYYELKMTISDWLCKDAEGKFFVVPDQQYRYLSGK